MQSNEIAKKISDFIYDRPELVAVLLSKYGYTVSIENKRLINIITELNTETFKLLYSGNEKFADDLASLMQGEGYSNFVAEVIGFVGAFGSSLITAFTGQDIAKKQRELQENIANATRASEEKLANAKLATMSETERIKMIGDSITNSSILEQKRATMKLNNTWIYIAGIGGILGILYGISLIFTKKKKNE